MGFLRVEGFAVVVNAENGGISGRTGALSRFSTGLSSIYSIGNEWMTSIWFER